MKTHLKDQIITKSPNLINIREYYEKTKIDDILFELEKELIGLKEVKVKIKELSSVLLFDRIREIHGLSRLNTSLHMSFTGRSGTGKTSVAAKLALIFRNLGYLTKGHIFNVTRDDLVGQYVGHTAPKTKEQLQKSHGGVLFIDDAYQLHKPDNERDYGAEAIELILQIMENQRDDLVIIFSGEKQKIENFFTSNPGLSSRVGNHINFKDYEIDDLLLITKFIIEEKNRYKCSNDVINLFKFYITQLMSFPTFANVRTLKIFIQQILGYQANRVEKLLYNNEQLIYNDIIQIIKEDFDSLNTQDFINIIGSEKILLNNN
jgi:probable Rubsico expression protein CbbX